MNLALMISFKLNQKAAQKELSFKDFLSVNLNQLVNLDSKIFLKLTQKKLKVNFALKDFLQLTQKQLKMNLASKIFFQLTYLSSHYLIFIQFNPAIQK